jgi:hypothetical protein
VCCRLAALADSFARAVTVGIFAGAIKIVRDVLKNDRRLKLLVRAMCDMMECLNG